MTDECSSAAGVDPSDRRERNQRWDGSPSGWRRFLFPGIWLVYLGQTVSGLSKHNDTGGIIVGVVILVIFAIVYLAALAIAVPQRPRLGWMFVGALVALTAIATVFAHEDAFAMLVYVAVIVVGVTELDDNARRRRLSVVLLALVATFLPPLVPSWHAPAQWGSGFTVLLVALAMFGFFGLIRSNRELAKARSEVARLAAETERSRIARDLHDLLGHSLTTITVKAGLARRLSERDPHRAAAEITEVEQLSRSALADVRAAVAGYRDVTLAGELASAREVLRAAGVDAQFPRAIDVVDPEYRTLFGWVVREGITNVVRHARAGRCTVALGPNWVEIIDDGRGGSAGAGNGLTGLRERVSGAGGSVTLGRAATAGWRLRVDVPMVPTRRDSTAESPTVTA
jgi:two-component system, NarL family, sensor histidine kinase DesK